MLNTILNFMSSYWWILVIVLSAVFYKAIFRLFGITRTPLFNLRKAGKIRSISTAHGGATYGKRLFNVQSVRDFLEAQERDQNNANKEGALV